MKITFKKHPKETGLSAVGNPFQGSDIKVDGKVVGCICAPTWQSKDNLWSIMLHVAKDNSFVNKTIKQRFEDDSTARIFAKDFVAKNIDSLYKMED